MTMWIVERPEPRPDDSVECDDNSVLVSDGFLLFGSQDSPTAVYAPGQWAAVRKSSND
jgi:hypothetical protein